MSAAQDYILSVIEDPGKAAIIANIWKQIDGDPLMAARFLRSIESVKATIRETLEELPAQWEELEKHMSHADIQRSRFVQDLRDFRGGTLSEMKAAFEDLKVMQDFFQNLNEDAFLNKANRMMELCDRIAKAKRDGTLDILKKLLT